MISLELKDLSSSGETHVYLCEGEKRERQTDLEKVKRKNFSFILYLSAKILSSHLECERQKYISKKSRSHSTACIGRNRILSNVRGVIMRGG